MGKKEEQQVPARAIFVQAGPPHAALPSWQLTSYHCAYTESTQFFTASTKLSSSHTAVPQSFDGPSALDWHQ